MILFIFNACDTITLPSNDNSRVIIIPSIPAARPSIIASALNTRDISFLRAPIALNIPISFLLSSTDI